jgi:DNA-binding MarR family transcriptional regulator
VAQDEVGELSPVGTVQWLSDEEQRAWRTLVGTYALLDRALDQQLRADSGLSHIQYGILAHLSASPDGELRMQVIADGLALTKSGLSYQIAQLEKDGLVKRRTCPSDDRGVIASLTPLGVEKLREAAPGHVDLVRALVIEAFTPEQLADLAERMAEVQRRTLQHSETAARAEKAEKKA